MKEKKINSTLDIFDSEVILKVLYLFYKNPNKTFRYNEIKKQTNLGDPAPQRAIKILIEKELMVKTPKGDYKLTSNFYKIKDIFALFITKFLDIQILNKYFPTNIKRKDISLYGLRINGSNNLLSKKIDIKKLIRSKSITYEDIARFIIKSIEEDKLKLRLKRIKYYFHNYKSSLKAREKRFLERYKRAFYAMLNSPHYFYFMNKDLFLCNLTSIGFKFKNSKKIKTLYGEEVGDKYLKDLNKLLNKEKDNLAIFLYEIYSELKKENYFPDEMTLLIHNYHTPILNENEFDFVAKIDKKLKNKS